MAANAVSVPVSRPTRPGFVRRNAWPLGFLAAAVAVFVFYYLIVQGTFESSFVSGVNAWLPMATINEALIWTMCALGLNIVVGYAGLLDLGFVAFWAIGGYVAGWIMSTFFDTQHINVLGNAPAFSAAGIHLNFWFVLIAGAVVCAFFGVLIGAPTLRLRSDYLALVTLGFGEIIPQVFRNGDNIGGVNVTNGNKGINPVDQVKSLSFGKGGVTWKALGPFDDLSRYLIFVLLTVLIVFMSLRLREGRLGRAWLAIREDELAASAMGIPLMRTKLAAYAIGAVAGGIAGVAFALHLSAVLPDRFQFSISITLLAMVVLGGMGNVWGVMLGALVLAWFNATGLKQMGETFNSAFGTDVNFPSWSFLIFGLVLVIMMLFRREGLLPERRTRLVLREPGRTEAEALGADMEAPAPELDAVTHPTEEPSDSVPSSVPTQSGPVDPTATGTRIADGTEETR